ncbi:cytochrome P450 family protein [Nocardia alni]|uniref:cytochrome P450 family protein n=1 Tax=Nocardia alni TaxID=2815723 RepID=UPI001C21A7C0|nr:cytochrome P450 [Nocardia alni]
MTHPTTIDLNGRFFTDPNELYERLRRESPVVRVTMPTGLTAWLVTRYEDVRPALNDPRLSKHAARYVEILDRQSIPRDGGRLGDSMAGHMLNTDPPDHTRLRKLVNHAFTPRAVARMRPRIEEIAHRLADSMAREGAGGASVDLIDEFAFPLPMTVICELLGVPEDARDDFRAWSNTLLAVSPQHERIAAAAAVREFLARLVQDKAENPGDDMLSAIVQASEDGESLSLGEAMSTASLLLVAGHETTVNLIGNGVLALLRHPDQLAALRADPSLAPGAVEEILRFDGPVNLATLRYTTEPVEFAGTTIPADEVVLVSLVSANRDPDRYHEPAELDITRDTTGHVAFGHGIHHCLGAPLARLEGEIALHTLVQRFPDLALAEEPERLIWRESTLIHGVARLPVRL